MSQVLEFGLSDGLILFMNEIHRILKPNGKFRIIVPYFSSGRAFQDPTHTRYINEWTFLYFNKQWRKDNLLDHYNTKADFDFVYGFDYDQETLSRNDEFKNFATKHYVNSVNDLHITLTKREPSE